VRSHLILSVRNVSQERLLLRLLFETSNVWFMPPTRKRDSKSPVRDSSAGEDVVIARLRVEEHKRLAAKKGASTVVAAAELHGLRRTQLFDYRAGRKAPRLEVAMRMAADLGTTVEKLFELKAAA
jgi:hypothetical protein